MGDRVWQAGDSFASRGPLPGTAGARPRAAGKFLRVGDETLRIRGVTYGAFKPTPDGREYTEGSIIDRDFAQMAAWGINAVRIPHTVPPRRLLDVAQRHGLWVMVGLSAEQSLGYVVDGRRDGNVESILRERVRTCAGHPALLCYALGNEISPQVTRWYGRRRVERYLRDLASLVRKEDPLGLVTHVNFPTTEYLDLPFLDLVSFNVYLERREMLCAYLGRLQTIAEDRPLLLSEVGLDSQRNGELGQARSLGWQVEAAFSGGCAGVFVFAWTDEWYRGEKRVEDWSFGLTDVWRRPKPALPVVRDAFAAAPAEPAGGWPRISVVVCSHNGNRTIGQCLEKVLRQDYPDFELIVVDDGSTDGTRETASRCPCRLISTENRGLSSARNTGMAAATGEIIAYIDDDAWPDSGWLRYLGIAFREAPHAAVGGPTIAPAGDGPVADCVANAPGGPAAVLLSDREAEHIPGCNMAFRAADLRAVGGFDTQFRVAGDDVDVCWRITDAGGTIGYHPAAAVWHHRRGSLHAYWRQQRGYGRAERLLMRKWPGKYNADGQLSWRGRIYDRGLTLPPGGSRDRVFHGLWGTAPFQRLYTPAPGTLRSLPLTPEWWLLLPALAPIAALGATWHPLLLSLPVIAAVLAIPLFQSWASTRKARFTSVPRRAPIRRLGLRLLTTALHLVQPIARLAGRWASPLPRWEKAGATGMEEEPGTPEGWRLPRVEVTSTWCAATGAAVDRIRAVEEALRSDGAIVCRGTDWDAWDLEVVADRRARTRLVLAVEDYPGEGQLVRWRWWPRVAPSAWVLPALYAMLCTGAALAAHPATAAALGLLAAVPILRIAWRCGRASALVRGAAREAPATTAAVAAPPARSGASAA